MMKASPASLLTPHPRSNRQFVDTIEVKPISGAGQKLKLVYRLKADMTRLRVPVASAPRRMDGLWQHTCFEAFIKAGASANYYEFNFSPSGEWAAYAFHSYRDGGPLDDDGLEPAISVQREADCLKLAAAVHLDRLPAFGQPVKLLIGLSAVIEAFDGSLSYWALNHPSDKPDFHHSDSFVLELALPGESA